MERVATELVCSCGPSASETDDDPGCPVHGCTCSSVAGHLLHPCAWGRSAADARQRQSEARVRSTDDGRQAHEDRQETLERAAVVAVILERCKEELGRLELVPHLSADEVNGLSSAKGFAARAEDVLKRGLGL